MLGPSLITKNGDLLMDLIIFSLIIILPALFVSVRLVKNKKNYIKHKNIQLGLFWTLFIAIILFEYDLKSQGGIWEMTKNSQFGGTDFLRNLVYIHLSFSFSTAGVWLFLIPFSLKIFKQKLGTNKYSKIHKVAGWCGFILMIGTGITGACLYFIGFN